VLGRFGSLRKKCGIGRDWFGVIQKADVLGTTELSCIDDVFLSILRSPMLTLRPLRDTHRLITTTLLILTPLDRLRSTTIRTYPNKSSSRVRDESVDCAIQNAVRGLERKR